MQIIKNITFYLLLKTETDTKKLEQIIYLPSWRMTIKETKSNRFRLKFEQTWKFPVIFRQFEALLLWCNYPFFHPTTCVHYQFSSLKQLVFFFFCSSSKTLFCIFLTFKSHNHSLQTKHKKVLWRQLSLMLLLESPFFRSQKKIWLNLFLSVFR